HDAGVFTRALQHLRTARGKRSQHGTGVLIGAVLAPQRAHDTQLGERRLATEHVDEPLIFLGRETVLGDERGRYARITRSRRGSHHHLSPNIERTTWRSLL